MPQGGFRFCSEINRGSNSNIEINSKGFLNVPAAAKEARVERFVYASSSSVYGDSITSLKKEDQLGRPLSPYAVSKLTNEMYGEQYYNLYGFETIGLRYFNAFGQNQDPNGVYAAAIPKFMHKLINGEQPIIYGDGKQTRDFTHISNVVHANLSAIFGADERAFGQAFNVACGQSYSLNEVVSIIKAILAINGVLTDNILPVYERERKGDIRDSLVDITKIVDWLDYRIQLDFRSGMDVYVSTLLAERIAK